MEDYIVNKAGAKIFRNINKHELLHIPILESKHDSGVIYEVLSVGNVGGNFNPIITIKKPNRKIVAYRLPSDLTDWVNYIMGLNHQGIKVLPSKVEFGNLDKRVYAEII